MSRYRPPQPRSTPYITAGGYEKMEQELRTIWVKRAHVTQALSAAAAEGDRSENAEYIYRKKELAGLDRRIRYLQRRMPSLTVVRNVAKPDQVFFGAWVLLEQQDGSTFEYRIVGPDEIESDSSKGYISIDSPLARAMLRKQIGDEVELKHTPTISSTHPSLLTEEQHKTYVVVNIRY